MKATLAEMEQALTGRVTPHHRFMLGLYLGQVDATDAAVAQIEIGAWCLSVSGNSPGMRRAYQSNE
jgi:hypothetical protein